ncbi:16S rRNA processing protein RimM [Thermaerobacter sp. FW80]|uniref:ribosome maturation factor RimM n=1 Tax=Thermaerobacter sp. FW80 TaxID=2546351 RepID=UPI001074E900|nr:ribosome maturation factor RimM [Thermaerobacter sp. FW80]QBS37799.1 16S rRNA processing protein RimM [Thermaerobacter sp. FW80]
MTLAAILAPWGIRGEVKVDLLSDDPERLRPGLEVWVAPPGGGPARPDTVEWARPHGRFWRVKLAGCPDRTAAEALRGGRLQVPEDRVPPLPEGRYYVFQLVGLRVLDPAGRPVGRVRDVLRYPANDVIVVDADDGREVLVPAIRQAVAEIDLAAGRLVLGELPGLLD